MTLNSKKVKDFDNMSAEDKYVYATTWESYKQVVAIAVANNFEDAFGLSSEEVDFELELKEITKQNEEETAHFILDVHQELGIKVDEAELKPYDVYDTLFDLVLILSAEMTDEKLGYISMFDEMELEFN